jgi:hypothetical protein
MTDTIETYQAYVAAEICCMSDYTDFQLDDNTLSPGAEITETAQ